MIAAYVPGDLLAGALSSLVVVVAALAISVSRLGSRIARIEEWIRINEFDRSRPRKGGADGPSRHS